MRPEVLAWLQASGLWTPGNESDPYGLGDFANGAAVGNSGLSRRNDESVEDFLTRAYQMAQGNGEWGTQGRSFNDLQNAGEFNTLAPVDVGGTQYHRIGDQWNPERMGPKQKAIYDQLQTQVTPNAQYGALIPQDQYMRLSQAAEQDNKGDFIDQGGLGMLLAAAATGAIGGGFLGGGAAAGGGEAGAGGLFSNAYGNALAGTGAGAGGASLADSLAGAGLMDFSAPGALGSIASTTPGLSLSPLATASGFSLAPGAGLTFEGAPISEAWGVNPRLTDFINTNRNPFESGDDPLTQMDFSQPSGGIASTTPGLSLNALSTAGGLSLAPGAGLGGGGGMSFLTDLFSPSSLLNFAGNIGGSLINANAAKNAAGTLQDSAAQSNALLASIYNQNRADLEPWRQTGVNALANLAKLTAPGSQVSQMQLDPGYQFRMDEGTKAIEHSAAAKGLLQSGANLKGITRYGQDYASGEYGNIVNRNLSLAGLGQTATNSGIQASQNYGNSAVNNILGAGNARASGYVGQSNAVSGGVNSFLNNYNQQGILNQLLQAR